MTFLDGGCFGCLVWGVVAAGTWGLAHLFLPLAVALPLHPKMKPLLAIGWGVFSVFWLFYALISFACGNLKTSWRWFALALGWLVGATLIVNATFELASQFFVLDRDWSLIIALLALSFAVWVPAALFERFWPRR